MAITLDSGLSLRIGDHSYIHDQTIRNPSGALTHITIGKFCSIATDLTIIGYDHHHEWITTYPFLDDGHRPNWPGTNGIPYPQEARFGSNKSRGDISIGNDVWIGYNVKLFKGVTIGNGAVIGACSLVNKSVEPYTIVAGTPARPIRKRFSDQEIEFLQKIQWWDWPEEMINRYLGYLCSSDFVELERLLSQDPVQQECENRARAEACLALADKAYSRNDLPAARDALAEGLSFTPNSLPLLTCLGNVQFQLADFDGALRSFTRAAELDPGNADLLVRVANSATRCGQTELVDQALNRSLALNSGNLDALKLAIHRALEDERYAEGAQYGFALVAANPDDTLSLLQLGKCLREINDTGSARWCYERALVNDPACELARTALSRLGGSSPVALGENLIEQASHASDAGSSRLNWSGSAEASTKKQAVSANRWDASNDAALAKKILKIVERVRPYTMVPDEAMVKTIELTLAACTMAEENDVIAECGTWKGGSSLAMILAQKEILGCVKHPVWMFDSFQGLPEPTPDDGRLAAEWREKDNPMFFNNCRVELDDVLAMMRREQIDESHFRIFKGWFNQTLEPAALELTTNNRGLALLRFDGDWYESTRDCLRWMFPLLRKGAPCIMDDYYAWDGCALALHEYFGEHRIAARLRTMPVWQGIYFWNKIRETLNDI